MIIVSEYNEKWAISQSGIVRPVRHISRTLASIAMSVSRETIYIRELSVYIYDIIRLFKKIGIQDITEEHSERPKKKEAIGSMWYIISSDGKAISLTVQLGGDKKDVLNIYNLDNLLPLYITDLLQTFNSNVTPKTATAVDVCQAYSDAVARIMAFTTGDPITLSSLAWHIWTQQYHPCDFKALFPDARAKNVYSGCTLDDFLRPSYRGGWCYLNAQSDRRLGAGIVLDRNSSYPTEMEKKLPYGHGVYFRGEPSQYVQALQKTGNVYVYYHLTCKLELKKDHLPFLTIPHNLWYSREPIVNTKKEVELTLAEDDYLLMHEQYNVSCETFIDGVYFRTTDHLFHKFIDFFYTLKKTAKTSGDKLIAKLILNSLSGNLAKKAVRQNISVESGEPSIYTSICGTASLIYIGSAVTARARRAEVQTAQKCYNRFRYADTDSVHLTGVEIPEGIDIGNDLGQWKIEKRYTDGIYWARKKYALQFDKTHISLTCAGLSHESTEAIEKAYAGDIDENLCGIDSGVWRRSALKVAWVWNHNLDKLDDVRIPQAEFYSKDFKKIQNIRFYHLTRNNNLAKIDIDDKVKFNCMRC